ncbi:Uma2 family endonuclease [Sulfurivirga sp.]|uniref:Uma2 family endonuclease n=1 Tax=Sulfurivirga sp. TaxID=2614236 RepID=UPI0025F0564C|nr:Uma2 family endonuclease [Sulfurivirga sp.]
MPAVPDIRYTVADHARWEGDWELVEGHPVALSPAPVVAHQLINTRLMAQLTQSLERCEHCLAIAEAEWHVDDDTVFRPDGVVICYEPGRYLDRPPVLAVEVVSPASVQMDLHYKFERYATEGVRFYLIAWPEERRIKLYRRNDEGRFVLLESFTGEGEVELPLHEGCTARLDFARVFHRL